MQRRNFIKMTGLGSASITISSPVSVSVSKPQIATIQIDPKPVFELSPYLYMQFMEPLGTNFDLSEQLSDKQLLRPILRKSALENSRT